MNLLTPIAGFLIGYGGIMGYQVIDSTYKGEMPGPKSFGYFIGGMTLLSAATIYALGRTDKVFNAEGDSCQNCESPSPIQTTPLLDKWGEISEYKFCGAGCEGQYMRENKMLKAGFSWQGRRRKDEYEAQGLSQFTPNELTQSSAIHGDFDHASLNYSGHQNMILSAEGNYNDFIEDMEGVIGKYGEMKDFDSGYNPQDNLLKARMVVEVDDEDFDNVEFDAETMMPEKQCVICGGPYIGYGHNPEPIFPMSRGRCCDVCNATVVIPYRLGGMNFRFGEDFESETTRKFRNRFEIKERGNRRSRAATGVKRNIWKNFFRKDAENMSDELDMVMAQLYEIEDMKNPTPEDLTNYQNLLTRYYEVVRFNAEQKTARVRTMSGKPVSETLRKLKQDKNLSAKDARTRKEIKAENMEVFEAVSSNHDTYMKILSQVIKNHESYSASKDAYLINRYGLATMKRFMKWADNIGYSTYWCFTDAARDWIEGDEISYRDEHEAEYMKDIKTLLRDLTDEKAKYQLATLIAKENSDLARIYNWTTDSQHKEVISLDNWDKNQFVLDFLATDEEQESYYSQERLTLGSKNVSMILNLGGYEDEDDEATFFDEVSPKSGKIPRNLPNTASLLDYLENNAEQFEDMLHHNDGLNYLKQLRDLYGWSFAIHPAQKYIYEEDEIYIEWQLKRAIPAKKRQQLKLDAQKQIREFRARLLF